MLIVTGSGYFTSMTELIYLPASTNVRHNVVPVLKLEITKNGEYLTGDDVDLIFWST